MRPNREDKDSKIVDLRRTCRVDVPIRDIVSFIHGQDEQPEMVRIARYPLPPGYQIVSTHVEELPQRVTVIVYHPSFPEIQDGDIPPLYVGNGGDQFPLWWHYCLATEEEIRARALKEDEGE